jgi:hypothetical protein
MIRVDAVVEIATAFDTIASQRTNQQAPAVRRRKGGTIECCEARKSGRRS